MNEHTCTLPFDPHCLSCQDEVRARQKHSIFASTKLRQQVTDFHRAFNVPTPAKPSVPDRDRVTLRLRLIAEEFCELLEACDAPQFALQEAKHWIAETIAGCGDRKSVDLVKAVDALADIDYVVEGSRIEFGVDGKPVAGPVRADGKVGKPPGWSAPDIRGLLIAQGWEP